MSGVKQYYVESNHNQQPVRNFVIDPVATLPAGAVAGQHVFNTTDGCGYFFDGTDWKKYPSPDTCIEYTQAGHGLSLTNNVPIPAYSVGGVITPALANVSTTLQAFYVTRIIDADTLELKHSEVFEAPGHGLVVGQYYYLSDTTAGGVDVTPGAIDAPAFYVISPDVITLIDNRPALNNTADPFPLFLSRNTDIATDILTAAGTPIPIFGNVLQDVGGFLPAATNVTAPQTGLYKIQVNVHTLLNGAGARENGRLRIRVGGTARGAVGATGYIRNASGHTESSYHIAELFDLNAGDVIDITLEVESNDGLVTMAEVGSSSFSMERIR